MERDSDINPVYTKWKSSTGQEKEFLLEDLAQKMERFAMAVCWQRLPDHKDELDALVNGIVWKACQHLEAFRGKSRFSTWFYRIVVNDCNRFLRNAKKRCETSLEEEMPARGDALDAKVDLISLLDGLDGEEHTLFRLVAEGQDFETIARALGKGHGAVRVQWLRLKEKLRDAIL